VEKIPAAPAAPGGNGCGSRPRLRKSCKIGRVHGYTFMTDSVSRQTPPSLLVRIRDARDAASWQTFVDLYAPLIYRYCRRRGLQEADAADVSQDVLLQVARSIRTFEYQPERGRFRDWLGVVTRGKVVRWRERHDRSVNGAGGRDSGDALAVAVAPEADSEWTAAFNAHVLRAALERIRPHFEPATWRAFELEWLENRPAAEVARTLDLPVTAVYVAKSRVLKRLRDEVLLLAEDVPQGC
jgi:RNA polymerase sigma-70 factor (ECF subfamily)